MSSASSFPPPQAAGQPEPQAARRPGHREFAAALALGVLGAGVALLGSREPWAHVRFPAQNPIPGSTAALTGQDLAPAASALAIAGLACLAAVIATRRLFRRITGLLLAGFGAGIAVVAVISSRGGHVAAAAAAHAPGPFGAGAAAHPATAGPRPQITMVAFPWWAVALAGGLVLVGAGALTVWRGTRWPGMSSRYERPGGAPPVSGPVQSRDPATVWEALDRGTDPTV
jgi:uncharacterized membrane protein (TIGR02234 family)